MVNWYPLGTIWHPLEGPGSCIYIYIFYYIYIYGKIWKNWSCSYHGILGPNNFQKTERPKRTQTTLRISALLHFRHLTKTPVNLTTFAPENRPGPSQKEIHLPTIDFQWHYSPKNKHGTQKWGFGRGFSFSKGWFSGSMLVWTCC